MTVTKQVLAEKFSFMSSLKDDVWHQQTGLKAYQWSYFDALSDNGRESLVIIFYDNFVFSPRYQSPNFRPKVPAVVFCYYRDGKPIYRAFNEFSESDFNSSLTEPFVQIRENLFNFESAPYGTGYRLEINFQLSSQKKLEVRLEWLLIESDFEPGHISSNADLHHWNLVAPRADVTGHIKVSDKKGKLLETVNFRGTGYHDHHWGPHFFNHTIETLQWGRAHFADSTAIFCRSQKPGKFDPMTKLYVVKDGELRQHEAEFEAQNFSRNLFGIKYPARLRFISEDNMRLRVKQTKVIDSSLSNLRFLSEMTLTLRDGKPRQTIGITEHIAPKALKYRWLDWLVDTQIRRPGEP